ncbi:PREDICTED: apolipoprotein A-V [Myotis brandtii]|uniref:apolipoprotein A-V n=1 Tax=Myotis brandtii TaxID=109478 RepID=UPI0003BB905F|nr:PREDICTED: apolipoprotein A-V [Myotis brandtii]
MARMTAALAWALALLSAFSTAEARKGLRVNSGQSSGDKGRVEQTQQQKLARESASLKGSLEQDLHNMDKLLEKLGPLSGQGSAPPGLPPDPEVAKLTLKAKALHAGIQQNLDHLREELSAYARTGGERAHPDPQALSQEVRQRLQAFRQDTFLQIAAFTRAIDQETEEVQQQLAPPPPSHSAFAPEFLPADSGKARSRLQARLEDLWEDINYSLRDHDLGHGGEP